MTDLKLRYRNSYLGFFWSFLEPLLLLGILYLVFTYLLRNDIENYPLYLLYGLITWHMFARGTSAGLSSILSRGEIIKRTPLPLEIPALSATITSLIMMTLDLCAFFVFVAIFQFIPPITALLLPLLVLLEAVLVFGLSLPLSVLNPFYRDLQHIWVVVLQAGFFLSPVMYTFNSLPQTIHQFLYINPMVGILDLGRALVLHTTMPSTFELAYALVTPFIILAIGYCSFKVLSKRVVEQL